MNSNIFKFFNDIAQINYTILNLFLKPFMSQNIILIFKYNDVLTKFIILYLYFYLSREVYLYQ